MSNHQTTQDQKNHEAAVEDTTDYDPSWGGYRTEEADFVAARGEQIERLRKCYEANRVEFIDRYNNKIPHGSFRHEIGSLLPKAGAEWGFLDSEGQEASAHYIADRVVLDLLGKV